MAEDVKPAEDDQTRLKRAVGRLLWRADLTPDLTPEMRKEHWAEHRRDYLARAGKIIRHAPLENVSLALADHVPPAAAID